MAIERVINVIGQSVRLWKELSQENSETTSSKEIVSDSSMTLDIYNAKLMNVSIEANLNELIKKMGLPKSIESKSILAHYYYEDFVVSISPKTNSIFAFSVNTKNVKTLEGIMVGSTYDQVIESYGEPFEIITDNTEDSIADKVLIYLIQDNKYWLKFGIKDNEVIGIVIVRNSSK